jgi:3-hydroxy acid dehydrogenase/malonic semialdehyde reductase
MNIFITGATSGFGKAIAEKFATKGNALWLTGRRMDRLENLKSKLETTGASIQISCFDVRDKESVQAVANQLKTTWGHLDIIINNAGLALGMSTIDEGNIEDWETMIDTNIKGLLYITRALSPILREQKQGHIINIGSTAGKVVYQNGNVYCATKFAVDALNQTMRIDLLPHNIKVTAINPGMAETEFSLVRFKGDEEKASKAYQGFDALQAEDIANAVYYCATLPPHVCVNDMTITCTRQANSIYKITD